MCRESEEFPSFFTPQGDRPLIVDCGSNIGVSALEWKSRWPQAEVLCFEPDPFAFRLLDFNIEQNDIPGIRAINAALSDTEGTAIFYGDIGQGADARGNSLAPEWGKRSNTKSTEVKTCRLSKYIADRDVAFLKLDVEGFEQRVLTDIKPHLNRIDAMYIEVHETKDLIRLNSAEAITQMLTGAGFTVEEEERYSDHALPAHLSSWQASVDARQTQLLCWR